MTKTILDMDTRESAIVALAVAADLSVDEVEGWLASFGSNLDWDELVDILTEDGRITLDWSRFIGVRCFHYTRTMAPDLYKKDGLLPLTSSSVPRIWASIAQAIDFGISSSAWLGLCDEFLADTSHARRDLVERVFRDPPDGPWGRYTRVLAYRGVDTHYFNASEFTEEALLWLERRTLKEGLVGLYKRRTRPAFVHFVADTIGETEIDCLLRSLYHSTHDPEHDWAPQHCFDGAGAPIAPSAVERVELIADEDIGRDAEEIDAGEFRELKMSFANGIFTVDVGDPLV